jgi:hypothetical protein
MKQRRWKESDVAAYQRRGGGAGKAAPAKAAKSPSQGCGDVARVRSRKEPNRTEREYEQLYLYPGQLAGEIAEYFFESLCLVLAVDTRYYPDWLVRRSAGRLQIHEVKGGYKREDAFQKFKLAAEMFGGCFDFFLCEKLNSGEWRITEYRKGASR